MKIQIPLIGSLIAIVLIGRPATAQQVLQRYVQEGLQSNLQLQQEQLHYEKSLQSLYASRALFMPQVGIQAAYTLADGGRRIQFPVGDLLNPVYATLNQLTDSQQFPQIANVNEQFLPNQFHDTKLRVVQPLFNPDIYFAYKAQKELVTVQQAQRQTFENELKYNIAAAYYQYLQSEEAVAIAGKAQHTLRELVKVNQKLVNNQKATRDAVLGAEYELSRVQQQLAEAQKNRQVARAYFNFLLNRDLQTPIDRDSTLALAATEGRQVAELTSVALAQRHELKQLQGGMQASNQALALNKANALLPKVNVVGDVGYQGFGYNFDSDQQYWLVQFSLSWDLFKGGERKARTQQARLDYQVVENRMEQLKRQIELQVIQSYHERENARQALATAQAGWASAEKNFQIVRARYLEGQALLIEYTDAQNKYNTAELMQSVRLYDFLRSEAQLQKTLSNL